MADLGKATAQEHKDISVALLHQYIDFLAKRNFFGQTTVSWERGRPVILKENATLRLEEMEEILKRS